MQHHYLRYRITSTAYLGQALTDRGVPVLQPYGGHAIIDYVIEVCEQVAAHAATLPGYPIVDEPPTLRHFTARFARIG